MFIHIQQPCRQLADYIKYYWILDNNSINHTELVYPTGELQILLHYRKPFQNVNPGHESFTQPHFAIYGHNKSYIEVSTQGEAGVIGIVFHSHSASVFIPIPLNDIADTYAETVVFDHHWREFEKKYPDLKNNRDRIDFIEKHFLATLKIKDQPRFNLIHNIISEIKNPNGNLKVHHLWNKYNLTERSLERLFNKYVGLSPRRFMQVQRINYSISLLGTEKSLTEISYESGFYDQAHFNRSFCEFTGITPSEFRNSRIIA